MGFYTMGVTMKKTRRARITKDPEIRAEIRKRLFRMHHNEELTVRAMALEEGLIEDTLYGWMRILKIPVNKPRGLGSRSGLLLNNALKEKILFLKNEKKLKAPSIAKKLGIGKSTLYKYTKSLGVFLARKAVVSKKSTPKTPHKMKKPPQKTMTKERVHVHAHQACNYRLFY